jgi:RNA polymerase sigma factor (TIGR02999 family)
MQQLMGVGEGRRGNPPTPLDALVPRVYGELYRLASRFVRRERDDTLHARDLVSEAYLRLASGELPVWSNGEHFLAIAARTMRQILVDHARRRCAAKRGAGERPLELVEELVGSLPGTRTDVLALEQALAALAALDDRKARVVALAYVDGYTQPEIAALLDVHVNTVARDLRFALDWIASYLDGEACGQDLPASNACLARAA